MGATFVIPRTQPDVNVLVVFPDDGKANDATFRNKEVFDRCAKHWRVGMRAKLYASIDNPDEIATAAKGCSKLILYRCAHVKGTKDETVKALSDLMRTAGATIAVQTFAYDSSRQQFSVGDNDKNVVFFGPKETLFAVNPRTASKSSDIPWSEAFSNPAAYMTNEPTRQGELFMFREARVEGTLNGGNKWIHAIDSLRPDIWLETSVMDFVTRMFQEQSDNCYITPVLMEDSVKGSIANWIDVFQYDTLLIPYYSPGHYTLVRVELKLDENQLTYYNSSKGSYQVPETLANSVIEYLNDKTKASTEEHEKKWNFRGDPKNPKQPNINDCGVFVLGFIECICQGKEDFDFDASNIPDMRIRYFNMIYSHKVVPDPFQIPRRQPEQLLLSRAYDCTEIMD